MNFFGIIVVIILGGAIDVLLLFLVALCITHPEDIRDEPDDPVIPDGL